MNIDGICLSVIDQMIFHVEQKSITDESIELVSLEDDDSVQEAMPTYNLHQFNDLYPHYPLTPGMFCLYLFDSLRFITFVFFSKKLATLPCPEFPVKLITI